MACIGVWGKGSSDTDDAGKCGDVVALCDIDESFLGRKAENFPQARKFHDFRRMFDEMEREIDAVTVSTPDHTHAPASMMAIKLKKHVYTQKPLTWSIYEARALREAAKKYGVCTQMGNQGQAQDGARTAIEVIRSGVLGDIHTVHVWTDRPGNFWKQAPHVVARPETTDAVPPHIHWDLWLGPATERPFVGNRTYHNFNWRGWRDFGTGALGDMACHIMSVPFLALRLRHPAAISAENSEVNPETFQQWATITWEFPADEGRGPLKVVWWEGMRDGSQNLPPAELFHGERIQGNGQLLVGSKGTMYGFDGVGANFKLLPLDRFEGFTLPEPTLPRLGPGNNDTLHKQEWVSAIRAGKPELAFSNFEFAGLLTETVLLGNVAIRAGKRIEWDGLGMQCRNAPEVRNDLHREYRPGWTL
jgi:predicted dehydrogenase